MLIKGIIREFAIDRKRILLRRTPLEITYPTVPKREIVKKIIERKSVGGGGKGSGEKTVKETQRASSSSSSSTSSSTSGSSSTSTSVSTETSGTGWTGCEEGAGYVYQPPISSSSGGCSINKY